MSQSIQREDYAVETRDGYTIGVREVRGDGSGLPVILLHQTRAPGLACFDLPVTNGSLAADLAEMGHTVYVPDLRGFGRSQRPPSFDDGPDEGTPAVRMWEAVLDLTAVAESAIERTGTEGVAVFGWGHGGYIAGAFAAQRPDLVTHLVMHNALYGTDDAHEHMGRGSWLEHPTKPGFFQESGAYRLVDRDSMHTWWDKTIPIDDKTAWRDPELLEAYLDATMESDPETDRHDPPAFRAPMGVIEDSYYVSIGRRFWDASTIVSPVLVTRSEHCFWSRPSDVEALVADLVHAPSVRTVQFDDATHNVHLDRPERGRDELITELRQFLTT
ncbi:hypothetical protein A3711_15850 [Erythrobacter sp. HI00D59]|jgi:pimeloyl-ACP methyl ester carboxylesterase|nr:hypothetical protein A3711_15850 [Erythrobacter sp. HI00D59]